MITVIGVDLLDVDELVCSEVERKGSDGTRGGDRTTVGGNDGARKGIVSAWGAAVACPLDSDLATRAAWTSGSSMSCLFLLCLRICAFVSCLFGGCASDRGRFAAGEELRCSLDARTGVGTSGGF